MDSDLLAGLGGHPPAGLELDNLRQFAAPWRGDEVGLRLDDGVDRAEVRELLTDSYCVLAPQELAAAVDRPEFEESALLPPPG